MATVKGVNRTILDATDTSHTLSAGKQGGILRVALDTYEAAAAASGTVIEIGGDLPVGANVVDIKITHDALGAATIDVGDAEDPNRYLNAYDVSSAGSTFISALADGANYAVDNTTASTPDTQILITTASAAITGTIKSAIYYTKD